MPDGSPRGLLEFVSENEGHTFQHLAGTIRQRSSLSFLPSLSLNLVFFGGLMFSFILCLWCLKPLFHEYTVQLNDPPPLLGTDHLSGTLPAAFSLPLAFLPEPKHTDDPPRPNGRPARPVPPSSPTNEPEKAHPLCAQDFS